MTEFQDGFSIGRTTTAIQQDITSIGRTTTAMQQDITNLNTRLEQLEAAYEALNKEKKKEY